LASLGHPCKFQRLSRLGSVTARARHSSSGRQPNFAALNRGRHLYSAGRPSRWALAHISSCSLYFAAHVRTTLHHGLYRLTQRLDCERRWPDYRSSSNFSSAVCDTTKP